MRKKGILVCFVLIAAVMSAASVWEGAAGIASVEEFPVPGHYIKSSAFPKNTIVEITNLENSTSVNAIVTDSASSAGILAILAPSTADSLGITEGAITRIRIRIPDGLFDSNDFAMHTSLMDPDVNPAAAVAMDRARYAKEAVPSEDNETIPEETVTAPIVAESPAVIAVPPVTAAAEIAELVPLEESNTTDTEPETLVPEEIPAETALVDESVFAEETPIIEDTETATTESVSDDPLLAVIPEPTDAAIAIEPVIEEEPLISEDIVVPEPETATVAESEIPEEETVPVVDSFEVEIVAADNTVAEPDPVAVTEENVEIDDFQIVAETVSDTTLTTEPEVAEIPEEVSADTIEVVSLDPTDPLPPPVVEDPAEVIAEPETILDEPELVIVAEPEPLIPTTVPAVAESVDELPCIEELDPASYYIQIAVMSDVAGTKQLIAKYNKYPLVVKKLEKHGKLLYRIMVGPVSLDEYGAALEWFKKQGFTDAFVASAR